MTIPPYELLLPPVCWALTILFLLAVGYNLRRHRWKPRRRKATLYRCTGCQRVYADNRNVPLSACPACGRLNQAARR